MALTDDTSYPSDFLQRYATHSREKYEQHQRSTKVLSWVNRAFLYSIIVLGIIGAFQVRWAATLLGIVSVSYLMSNLTQKITSHSILASNYLRYAIKFESMTETGVTDETWSVVRQFETEQAYE